MFVNRAAFHLHCRLLFRHNHAADVGELVDDNKGFECQRSEKVWLNTIEVLLDLFLMLK